MQAFEVKGLYIYADSQEEVDEFKKAVHLFIEENRQEGRAVTAKKLSEALPRWRQNTLVKVGIINFLNKQ